MAPGTPASVMTALRQRAESGGLRELITNNGGVDLCSNDYLGIARRLSALCLVPEVQPAVLGATGSRLVTGSTPLHEELEGFLAAFHATDSALLFGSGYEANLGLLGAIGGRNDTIIYDQLVHASMRDGVRLSKARSYPFRHNDLDDLRSKIKRAQGDCFIAVESVYSMDGDTAPLEQLCTIARETGAYLIVDEAHATGVYGARGEGLVQAAGLADAVFARVHTFGKALGYRGACVVGSHNLREFLINFAHPFIYSTAVDLLSLHCIRVAYEVMAQAHVERIALWRLIAAWRELSALYPHMGVVRSESPIQGIRMPGNREVVALELALRQRGFSVRAIRAPTVPVGAERIRICLHAFNRVYELRELFERVAQPSSQGEVVLC